MFFIEKFVVIENMQLIRHILVLHEAQSAFEPFLLKWSARYRNTNTQNICIILYKTFATWFIWKISFYFAFVINFYVFPAFSWSLYFFDFFQIWFCLSREAVLAIGNWQAILLNHYLIASRFFSLSVFIWKLYFLANILLRCHSMIICMYTYVF